MNQRLDEKAKSFCAQAQQPALEERLLSSKRERLLLDQPLQQEEHEVIYLSPQGFEQVKEWLRDPDKYFAKTQQWAQETLKDVKRLD